MATFLELDYDYITVCVHQMVGTHVLRGMENLVRESPPTALLQVFEPIFRPKLERVRSETLGRFCSYGFVRGLHDGPASGGTQKFLNRTGFRDIVPEGFLKLSGRELLVKVATVTLTCIARDIILQPLLQQDWALELQEGQDLAQAEHDMIHPREVLGTHRSCGRIIHKDELLPKKKEDKDNPWIVGVCPHCRANVMDFAM